MWENRRAENASAKKGASKSAQRHLQTLQLYMHIAVGFVHSPFALVLVFTVDVSSHFLLELELSPFIGINVNPVVGNPLGSFSDQTASM